MDKFMEFMDKLSGPLTTFGNYKAIKAIQNGLVGTSAITIVGSMFLVIAVLAKPDQFAPGVTILPFLSGLNAKFNVMNGLTIGLLALYAVVTIGISFGNEYGIKPVSSAMISLLSFIILTNSGTISATAGEKTFTALDVTSWGGAGLIVAIVAALCSVYIMHFCYERNIRIRMPEMVPPAIGESFSSLIPLAIVAFLSWLIKIVMGLDLATLVANFILPIFNTADNVFMYALSHLLIALLWCVGLHGNNIVGAFTNTFTTIWTNENIMAFAAGEAIPHVWAGQIHRLDTWVSSVWPILIYLHTSKKLNYMKPFAIACTPAAIFGIIEPVMYGLPMVLNPYFMISMILAHTITSIITYAAMASNIVARMGVNVTWCMPAPIIGLIGTGGDFKGVLLVLVNLAVGMVITYPFFKAYENSEYKKMVAAGKIEAIS